MEMDSSKTLLCQLVGDCTLMVRFKQLTTALQELDDLLSAYDMKRDLVWNQLQAA